MLPALWCLVAFVAPSAAPPPWPDARAEARAADVITKARGMVRRDGTRPGNPVTRVAFGPASRVTDREAAVLRQLPYVTYLHLQFASVSDAGLAHLRGLERLRYLNLADTRITDKGLVNLKGLARLEQLSLRETRVG